MRCHVSLLKFNHVKMPKKLEKTFQLCFKIVFATLAGPYGNHLAGITGFV